MTGPALKEVTPRYEFDEDQLRVDLAAVFRLTAMNDWHEAVANHFSLAVSPDGKKFLMNPRWKHFSRIKASDLLLLDADDENTMDHPDAPDPSAWCIHGRIHATLPHARCLLHTHMPYATAIASLKDPEIKPIDQNTARFYKRCAFDMKFGGIADNLQEGDRLAGMLGNRSIMMMGNHGVLVAANSVAEAFDDMYYLEHSCRNLVLAYSTGQPLSVLPDDVAEQTASQWEGYSSAMKIAHFEAMKEILDERDPSYRD
jgi:ribulose-5-phosphate 4-epimerase/fuculose-1-phosphate aldolase